LEKISLDLEEELKMQAGCWELYQRILGRRWKIACWLRRLAEDIWLCEMDRINAGSKGKWYGLERKKIEQQLYMDQSVKIRSEQQEKEVWRLAQKLDKFLFVTDAFFFFFFFTVEPVGFPTAAYRLIVPLCFGSHLYPPGALRAKMARETSGRERENYGREMAE
jgi:hypothetical protein